MTPRAGDPFSNQTTGCKPPHIPSGPGNGPLRPAGRRPHRARAQYCRPLEPAKGPRRNLVGTPHRPTSLWRVTLTKWQIVLDSPQKPRRAPSTSSLPFARSLAEHVTPIQGNGWESRACLSRRVVRAKCSLLSTHKMVHIVIIQLDCDLARAC